MKTQMTLALSAVGFAAIVTIAGPAMAANGGIPPAQREGSVTYVNGGIGRREQMAMHHLAAQYPLRITFSERKDDEFIADVPVAITNTHGARVFTLSSAGPLLDVRLPVGKYRVSASFAGKTETRNVILDGKAPRNLYFHWSGSANS